MTNGQSTIYLNDFNLLGRLFIPERKALPWGKVEDILFKNT